MCKFYVSLHIANLEVLVAIPLSLLLLWAFLLSLSSQWNIFHAFCVCELNTKKEGE